MTALFLVVDDEEGVVGIYAERAEATRVARQYNARKAHARVLSEWRAARQAWEQQRESVALGYRTEEQMFAADNPMPNFRQWLTQSRRSA